MKSPRSIALLAILLAAITLPACTDNYRAKHTGGTMTIELPPGQKLVNATWKEDTLWYLTRPLRQGEVPETSTFQEKSGLGILQGAVVFKEQPLK